MANGFMGLPSPEQMKQLQDDAIERAIAGLRKLPISDVLDLAETLETGDWRRTPSFQSPRCNLAAMLLQHSGMKVRVAEWHVDNEGRCQHKRYTVGSTTRARHGEIGDDTWLEAWIA